MINSDLLTVVSDKIARVFNRSRATPAVAIDISKAFNRVWYNGLLHKLKSKGISRISGWVFGLILFFLRKTVLGDSGLEIVTGISS